MRGLLIWLVEEAASAAAAVVEISSETLSIPDLLRSIAAGLSFSTKEEDSFFVV